MERGYDRNRRKKRIQRIRRQRIRKVFIVLKCALILALLTALVMVAKIKISGRLEQRKFEKLAEVVNMSAENTSATNRSWNSGENSVTEDTFQGYKKLYEENNDFVGWLSVDGTAINYPVMLTADEPEYYLYRSFDGSNSKSGTLFVGEGGDTNSDCFIIYGHNMKNDTMFGTLDYYAAKEFWEENPSLSFTTTSECREYEIFAALETRVLYQNETGYRWYYQAGDMSEETFDELISYLSENALYDTGIIPSYGDQIIILSTCSYQEEDGRFLIAARRIQAEAE